MWDDDWIYFAEVQVFTDLGLRRLGPHRLLADLRAHVGPLLRFPRLRDRLRGHLRGLLCGRLRCLPGTVSAGPSGPRRRLLWWLVGLIFIGLGPFRRGAQ